MATMDHTPHGRGYSTALHYFHHANDYWTYQTGSCPSPANASVHEDITDLWEGKLNGPEGPTHGRVSANTDTCPYYQDENRTDCQYEDTVFTDFVLGVIQSHPAAEAPLFFCWTPHIVHAPLEVPASYLRAFDWTGGRAAGGPAWNRQQYMAMVSYLDASIDNVRKPCRQRWLSRRMGLIELPLNGQVTKALKTKQMWDDTLIVFSAGAPLLMMRLHAQARARLTAHACRQWRSDLLEWRRRRQQ